MRLVSAMHGGTREWDSKQVMHLKSRLKSRETRSREHLKCWNENIYSESQTSFSTQSTGPSFRAGLSALTQGFLNMTDVVVITPFTFLHYHSSHAFA